MQILSVIQGSDEWLAIRAKHHTASEAPAMMGCDPNVTRSELVSMKATGSEREFSDWAQKNILDRGHEVEALARPMAEAQIGEELYPATVTDDDNYLLASLDGMNMDGTILFEHKQWNAESAEQVAAGICPPKHFWQVQQALLITGAERVLLMISDGTPERCVSMWVTPDTSAHKALLAGWKQFAADLASYTPPEIIPAAVAAPQMALPAVAVTVTGNIAIRDNLTVFGDALTAYVERINRKPETDQDFADLEATVKALKTAEEALNAAESNALAQTGDLDALRRTVGQYRDLARTNRLMVEKLVKAEKENRRNAIMQAGINALRAHIDALNKRLGKPYMPDTQWASFPVAVKGLKTMASLQNAVDTELARAKIDASACADRIEINLNSLRDMAKDHAFLFADTPQLVIKANDDLVAVIKSRIAEHKAAEDKRLEAERERIRAEEEAKALAAQQAIAKSAGDAGAPAGPAVPQPAGERMEAAHAAAAWPAPVREPAMTTGRAHDMLDELTADMTVSELAEVLDAARVVLARRQARAEINTAWAKAQEELA